MELTREQHEAFDQARNADSLLAFNEAFLKMEATGVPDFWQTLAHETYRRRALEWLVISIAEQERQVGALSHFREHFLGYQPKKSALW